MKLFEGHGQSFWATSLSPCILNLCCDSSTVHFSMLHCIRAIMRIGMRVAIWQGIFLELQGYIRIVIDSCHKFHPTLFTTKLGFWPISNLPYAVVNWTSLKMCATYTCEIITTIKKLGFQIVGTPGAGISYNQFTLVLSFCVIHGNDWYRIYSTRSS